MSSKDTQSAELPKHPIARATNEAREGSTNARISSLDIVVDLLKVGMTSKSRSESLKNFRDFTELVSLKLDMSEIISTQVERSFIFDFHSMVHIRILHLPFPFSLSLFFFNICLTLDYFQAFLTLLRLNAFMMPLKSIWKRR